MTKIVLIIVHYKGEVDTLECLDSVSQTIQNGNQLYIYIIDNSQTSELQNKTKRYSLPIKYIQSPQNLGFAQGVNIGIQEGQKIDVDYFLLLNSDTTVPTDFLTTLIKFANTHKEYSLISPKIYFSPGYEFHKEKYKKEERGKVIWYAGGMLDWQNMYASHRGVDEVDKEQYDKDTVTDFATGCCMLMRKEVVEKIGLFDKNYFAYFEDVDYSQKAKQAEFRIGFTPNSFLWHKNASSSGKPGSPIHVYLQTRNRFYFGQKYAPWKTKLHLLREALLLLFSSDIAQKQAALDFIRNHMGKGSLPMFDTN